MTNAEDILCGLMDDIQTFKPKPHAEIKTHNGQLTLFYYTIEEYRPPKRKVIHKDRDCTYWYGEQDGFVSYGISYDTPHDDQPAGYMWSSRPGVFNALQGIVPEEFMDIIVVEPDGCRLSVAMTVKKVREMLVDMPIDYLIVSKRVDDEVCYNISN